MPGHSRTDWLDRIKAVEVEWKVAVVAADHLLDAVSRSAVVLPADLRPRDIRVMAAGLERTYLIRLFAVFETGVRSYWATVRDTIPRTRDLLDGVASIRSIPPAELAGSHAVREVRNRLVHEPGDAEPMIPLSPARKAVCLFFSRLPLEW